MKHHIPGETMVYPYISKGGSLEILLGFLWVAIDLLAPWVHPQSTLDACQCIKGDLREVGRCLQRKRNP